MPTARRASSARSASARKAETRPSAVTTAGTASGRRPATTASALRSRRPHIARATMIAPPTLTAPGERASDRADASGLASGQKRATSRASFGEPGTKGTAMSVEAKVKSIIAEQLGVGEDEIKAESAFIEDLGADSLDIVELVMAMEEEFEVEIPDEEAEHIKTVQDAINFINEHKK